MAKKSLSGVVLKETFVKVRRKWILAFILVNFIYIIAIAGLSMGIIEKKKTILFSSNAVKIIEEYRTKDKLYGILRSKGYSLGQGLDIAEAIVKGSKELELPLALIIALIDQESKFYDRRAIADPFMNITVGCQILKDFYDRYMHIEDCKVRIAKALTDYNNGENATNPNSNYAIQVNRKQNEYEKKLQ